MRKFIVACVAVALIASSASAFAAEPVSNNTLASMGLGGMKTISDKDGMAVRGKGWAIAFGGGWASLLLPTSINVYATKQRSLAGGANFSIANLFGKNAISGGFSLAGGF